MNSWKIRPPETEQEFSDRDRMLERMLGIQGENTSIAQEYPLVLDHRKPFHSFGLYDGSNRLIAHLNYLAKTILDRQGEKVGSLALVGNVVTDDQYQGQGVMSRMFKVMQTRVQIEGSQGILLWSDIERFYQNLGFRPVGIECRYDFSVTQIKSSLFLRLSKEDLDFYKNLHITADIKGLLIPQTLAKMLEARYPVPLTIERTLSHYETLLGIPKTVVALSLDSGGTEYGFMNRGSDMVKVLHEWGATSPTRLVILGLKLAEFCGLEDFLVLVPGSVTADFKDILVQNARSWSRHYLGLWWANPQIDGSDSRFKVEETFVWGLDSI